MQPTISDPLLTVEQLADYLGKSIPWVYTNRYALPTIKIGRHLRFRLADVDAWVEERRDQ